MFVSLVRRSLAACGLAALALPVCAAPASPPPYPPVVVGIDKVCTPVARGTAGKPSIRLARLDAADGTPGPWLRSNADLEERSVNSPVFHGGDFVIVNEAPALLTASETHRDAASVQTNPKTSAWCFEGGKLSRATFDLVLPDQQLEFRHTQYFDTDLDEPAADWTERFATDGRKGPIPEPSAALITAERYHTPEDLPFYEAYESALDRKLPLLVVPTQ